ncbi:MAG: hypothetical protein L0191_21705 [Acidobacteria bacterium]|nr:hypothetical protein [Acidobacteriota bacterium]
MTTMELRWLLEGEIPNGVERWFLSGARFNLALHSGEGEIRTDVYLIPDRCNDVIVKLGERRVEVKKRDRLHDSIHQSATVCGTPETWRKWIWFSKEPSPSSWHPDSSRQGVKKKKWLRRIRLVRDGAGLVAQYDHLGLGFLVELARIELPTRSWWTLAFDVQPEAAEAPPEQVLHQALSWTLEDFPSDHIRELNRANSFSYAELLSRYGRGLHGSAEHAGPHC